MEFMFSCDCVVSLSAQERLTFLEECTAKLPAGAVCSGVSERSVIIDYDGDDLDTMATSLVALDIKTLDPRKCANVVDGIGSLSDTDTDTTATIRTTTAGLATTTTTLGAMGLGWRDVFAELYSTSVAPSVTTCDDGYSLTTLLLSILAALLGTALVIILISAIVGKRKHRPEVVTPSDTAELKRQLQETRAAIGEKQQLLEQAVSVVDAKEKQLLAHQSTISALKMQMMRLAPLSPTGGNI